MSTNKPDIPDRIDQLMVEAATQGLSPQDEAELLAAVQADPALRDEAEAYELAATVIELSLMDQKQAEALPDALRAKLIESATAQMQTTQATPDLKLSGTQIQLRVEPGRFEHVVQVGLRKVQLSGRNLGLGACAQQLFAHLQLCRGQLRLEKVAA